VWSFRAEAISHPPSQRLEPGPRKSRNAWFHHRRLISPVGERIMVTYPGRLGPCRNQNVGTEALSRHQR